MTALKRLKVRIRSARNRTKRALRKFWQRLRTDPDYAEAAADLVVCGVQLVHRNPMAVRLVSRLADALIAAVRETDQPNRAPGLGDWSPFPT